MILVLGGSGSGKSEFAEKIITKRAKDGDMQLYYLAAMKIYGEEELKKVQRHRELRKDKGFITIEQQKDISCCIEKAHASKKAALLECISNLAANEMFDENKVNSCNETAFKIIKEVKMLDKAFDLLVVVSNNVFEDGIKYDDVTMGYIKAVAMINRELSKTASDVYETVAGIPVKIK